MCLSIPARIESIEDTMAKVSIGGTIVNASIQLIEDAAIGDFVLLHSGFAIGKISEKEAQETIQLLKDVEESNIE
ncbi:MAG: HypC/HybG/HupF family hydrogenase formation chaperone [Bacteroidota bacterium]